MGLVWIDAEEEASVIARMGGGGGSGYCEIALVYEYSPLFSSSFPVWTTATASNNQKKKKLFSF